MSKKDKYFIQDGMISKFDFMDNQELYPLTTLCNMLNDLEEQLSNAIIPKFKIGQEVWETRPFMAWEVTSIRFEQHNGILYEMYQLGHKGTDDYNCCVLPSDNDRFFATKEEAQAKLEELKNE